MASKDKETKVLAREEEPSLRPATWNTGKNSEQVELRTFLVPGKALAPVARVESTPLSPAGPAREDSKQSRNRRGAVTLRPSEPLPQSYEFRKQF